MNSGLAPTHTAQGSANTEVASKHWSKDRKELRNATVLKLAVRTCRFLGIIVYRLEVSLLLIC